MNPTTILEILRSIVIHHKPSDLCRRLNSFLVLDKMSQLNANNAGMTMGHYKDGLFWARDWFNKGQNPNDICIEYDALVVEPVKMATSAPFDTSAVLTYFVTVVGRVACDNCDCSDTVEGKRFAVLDTAMEVKKEFFSFAKYAVTLPDNSEITVWASEAQAEHLFDTGTWASYSVIEDIHANVQMEGFEMYVPEWNSLRPSMSQSSGKSTLVDNVVAMTMRIDVMSCDPAPSTSFHYDRPDVAALGIVMCKEC